MTLAADEFIRRFLIHVLPKRFHRIPHYGLLASGNRAANIARARELLATPPPSKEPQPSEPTATDEQRVLPVTAIRWTRQAVGEASLEPPPFCCLG